MFLSNSKANRLFVIQIVCLSVCWILGLIRFWIKLYSKTRAEDLVMYTAVLLYTAQSAFALYGIIGGGIGKPVLDISVPEIVVAFKAWYACELIYGPLAALVRTSIALLILRVCRGRYVRLTLYACLGVFYAFTVAYFFISLLQCLPPAYYWTQFGDVDASGSCPYPQLVPGAAVAHSVLAAVSDWIIGLFLPAATLWNVQMTKRNKVRAGILLGLGAVAGAIMIVRIPYIRVVDLSAEFLSKTVDVAMWSIIEPALGIAAGCLANMGSLIKSCPAARSKVSYGTRSRQNRSSVKSSFQDAPRVATVVGRGGTPVPFDRHIHVTSEIDIRSALMPSFDPAMPNSRGDLCV